MAVKIGVLGGIGPEATSEFYSRLIIGLQEKGLVKSNQDYPQIIINSIPAPEIINDNISEEELQPYIEGLKELDKFNPDFIVMVCNTIHLFIDRLQKEVNSKIIDLREEVREFLIRDSTKSVLIIGTPSTIRQGLYKFRDIRYLEPDKEEISQLSDAIFKFNKGVDKKEQIQTVKKICEKYINKGAEKIILGCTEFALMLDNENLPVINTIDILVECVLRKLYHN